jgi:dTDP-4-amino-4,6-dideoxygalactose transaminase
MRSAFLPFSPPLIGEEEIAEVRDTLLSDWITTGPKTKRFEEAFSQLVGSRASLALNSCTAGLHIALKTLGVGPGDAVITTPMTFCASVNVIEHVGARPILADVEGDTLNVDPARIEEAVAEARRNVGQIGKPRVILPVHLYGHPCDMSAIMEIAHKHGLAVVEDAAHALPATYRGRAIGTIADLTAFSFYATKNVTTGEGGMLTGAPNLIDRARVLSLHGMSHDGWNRYSAEGSWFYEVVAPGFKYNMTDIQAAIGIHQLRKLPRFQARRAEIVDRYNRAFGECEELEIPCQRPDVQHAWHLYVVRLHLEQLRIDRARFIEELRKLNIGASVHFVPVHLHPYYRDKYGFAPEAYPVAYREYQRIVSLPLYPRMSDEDVEDVVEAVTTIVSKNRR